MRYDSRKTIYRSIIFVASLLGLAPFATSTASLPEGLMLNLDFQQEVDGLIPSKTLYPLFVPRGELDMETVNRRKILVFQQGQGLSLPHSALLEPDGREWIVSTRVFARTDGIVVSQTNHEVGYIIYLKDGVVHAAIKTGNATLTLAASPTSRTTDCLNTWVSIELRILPNRAIMSLNRTRVAAGDLPEALAGKELYIRLGNHPVLPTPFKSIQDLSPDGFSGGCSALKILRQ